MLVPPFNQLQPMRVNGLFGLLSHDLASHVVGFLEAKDLNRLACVCRAFTQACAAPPFRSRIHVPALVAIEARAPGPSRPAPFLIPYSRTRLPRGSSRQTW